MYTLIINTVVAIAATVAFGACNVCSWGWAIFWGILIFVVGQGVTGFFLQKRVKAEITAVQQILMDGQKKMQAKVSQWQMRQQMRPGSIDPKRAQEEIARELRASVEKTLKASESLDRFNKWVPLMQRQVATLRLQLYWMIKDFKHVDELMPSALVIDPMMGAIKLARMYMLNQTKGMDKLFKKVTVRLRYGQGVLIYALYAWILVQRKEYDAANKILITANSKMENPVIKANQEALANNRLSQFTNAGLGDQWYALHLEQPKIKTQRASRFDPRARRF